MRIQWFVFQQIIVFLHHFKAKKMHQEYLYIRGMPTELLAKATVDQ